MTSPGTSDLSGEELTFGQRLKILRARRGMSRDVLGGLVGKSGSWVKSVEVGRLDMPKLHILVRLAEALRVRDLSHLTGERSMQVDMFTGPGHTRLPAVRAALNSSPALTRRAAPPVSHLRARLDQAWVARHSSRDHRDVLGRLLPGLITDAQLAAYQAEDRTQRRAAQAVLAEVYAIAQFFIAYQPAADLLWRVAERGMVAAQDSGDVHAIGVASWLMAQAHRDAGDWDAADVVTGETLDALRPHVDAGQVPAFAIWGALHFEAGYTAARRGEAGSAWRWWDLAESIASRLPGSYYHPVTSFSRAIMGAHATTVAVELRAGGESVRQAERAADSVIPSRPRRARHRIEQARAYYLDGQYREALGVLDNAYDAAPETIAYNGYARRILLEELDSRDASRRTSASIVATKVGLLTA
ncbi:Predicted transcriptional regulators [Marinactinospora thermotolerans DSM 45154]|uniref:Predicted transcriptional regulators n=1 Tax=Marinactinospora thermotolerans DSM 45154 TaxID=1122192 RepID=A0A1T4NUI8_9ACTN|nr:helix-turn-helix transcriptional regulator [Marinactinospora thermotolerans]SJZ82408.1 Predicted transcriptional regulators [Marinactinospora thermotolerans DSM 45154]